MEAFPGAEKTMGQNTFRRELAQQLRVDAVRASDEGGSGHPTSSMSAADLIAVLLDGHLRYDFDQPGYPGNDRLIFSKGHASPLLYAAYKAAGAIDDTELLSFRKLGSRLEGHPAPSLPWVDVATGSLGQGLPIGVGMALTGKRLDRLPYRVWVLCGDSELAEGSMWEAFEHAGHERLDNLVAILDINRLGQRGPTRHEWDLDAYAARVRAFGWQAIVIDGHDVEAIERAYAQAGRASGRPTAIVAKTRKGRGVRAVEDLEGFHGKPVKDAAEAIEELGGVRDMRVEVRKPEQGARPHRFAPERIDPPRYELGGEVPTRQAYGEALAALGSVRPDVVALDGEVADSTHAYRFAEAHPERFFEMYIAEQLMMGAAVGMQAVRGYLRRLPQSRIRLRAHGRGQPREPTPVRLPRRGGNRPGRSLPDGARGPGRLPRGAFEHRALSVRREPDPAAGGGDGGPRGHLLLAHEPRRDACHLRAGRRVRAGR
jgi:transketolase